MVPRRKNAPDDSSGNILSIVTLPSMESTVAVEWLSPDKDLISFIAVVSERLVKLPSGSKISEN